MNKISQTSEMIQCVKDLRNVAQLTFGTAVHHWVCNNSLRVDIILSRICKGLGPYLRFASNVINVCTLLLLPSMKLHL